MAQSQSGKTRGTTIAGSSNRPLQVRIARARTWDDKTQARFLGELAMTGNVTSSAAVVGMSVGGAYNRRAHDPAFAARWQAALVQGYERLEQLLLATALASIGGEPVGEGDAVPVHIADVQPVAEDGGDPGVTPDGRGQAVPGAGLVQLSSVTAIQFALAMLNQHRADQARGRKKNQVHRAPSTETDAVLAKLLDSLAQRRARS